MAILSKVQLIDYCLRKLGSPIVEINTTDDQIDDCFEQTIETWWHFHPDGLEKMYLKHQITGTKITLTDATGFDIGKFIINASGLKATILSKSGNVLIIDKQPVPNRFAINDAVHSVDFLNANYGNSTITKITLGDMDNGWIPVDDFIYGVTKVYPYTAGQSTSRNLFDLQYQLRLNNIFDLSSTTLAYYTEVMTHVQMLDSMLNGQPLFRFNRLQNKLLLDAMWGDAIRVGDYVLVECYRALDPSDYNRVYGEPWVRKFLIACIKQQWGTNIKKYQGMQLPGGVTVDGQGLFDEGTQEMKDLEDEIIQNGAPLDFFIG